MNNNNRIPLEYVQSLGFIAFSSLLMSLNFYINKLSGSKQH